MKRFGLFLLPAVVVLLSACSSRYAYNDSFEEDDIYYVSSDPEEYDFSAYVTESDANAGYIGSDDYYSPDYDDGGDTYIENYYDNSFDNGWGGNGWNNGWNSWNRPFYPSWGFSYYAPMNGWGFSYGMPLGYNFYNNYYPWGGGYNYGYSAFAYPYGDPYWNTFYGWNDPFYGPFYGNNWGWCGPQNNYYAWGYSYNNGYWNNGGWIDGGDVANNGNTYYGNHGSISGGTAVSSSYGNGGVFAGPRGGADGFGVKDPATETAGDVSPQKGERPADGIAASGNTRPSELGTSARENTPVSIVETRPSASSVVRGNGTRPSSGTASTRPSTTAREDDDRVTIPSYNSTASNTTREPAGRGAGVSMSERNRTRTYSGRTNGSRGSSSGSSRPSVGSSSRGSSSPSYSSGSRNNGSRNNGSSFGGSSSGSRSSGSSAGSRSSSSSRSSGSSTRSSSSRSSNPPRSSSSSRRGG